MAIEELQRVRVAGAFAPPARRRRITVIAPRREGFLDAVGELWRYRRFFLFFGRRFMRKRYSRTWLGVTWLPLRPALNVGAKLFVFGTIVGVSAGRTPYPIFLLISSAGWQLFSESLYWSTRSLFISRSTLRTVHVPRLVVIVSTAIPSFVDFLVGVGLAGIGLLYYLLKAHTLYLTLTWRSLFVVPAGLALIMLLGIGVGILTGIAGARSRDIRFMLAYFLNFLQYATPVVYPFEKIPNKWKPIAELNPMTGAMELFKSGLFGADTITSSALIVSLVAVAVIWGPGLWLFHRLEVRRW